MKILGTGDWHVDSKTPENRIDDYPIAQYRKVEDTLKIAKRENCEAIMQPGDFFNRTNIPDFVIRLYIQLLKEYNIPIFTVPGQHDLLYHNSDIANTPIGILDAAKVVKIVNEPFMMGDITIFGAGWEQEIPKIEDPERINILITHRMVIQDKKLWSEQKTYEKANKILRDFAFDLIVAGDNHSRFTETHKRRHLVNCGSLMRSRIDQSDHKPAVYIFDTNTKELEKHLIRTKKVEFVLDITKAEEEKEKNEELESFLENLNTSVEIPGLEFKLNVIAYLKENNFEKVIEATVNEFLAE